MAYSGVPSVAKSAGRAPTKIAFRAIAGGDLGASQTLAAMRDTARAALKDPRVLEAAGTIVRAAPARDYAGQVRLLRAWVASHTKFLRDPVGLELLRTPRYMLDEIARVGVAQGDCDDIALFAAALGLAVGLPARFVALGFRGATGPFTHVITELRAGDRWLELDTTRPVWARGVRIARRLTREV